MEVSASCTASGAAPDVAEAVKLAVGGGVKQAGVVKVLLSRET